MAAEVIVGDSTAYSNDETSSTKQQTPPHSRRQHDPHHLRKLNPLPRFDDHVTFREAEHIYEVDGKVMPISVTTVAKQYFGKFDAEKVAKGVASKSYPEGHKYHGKTAEQIVQMWTSDSDASAQGTSFHAMVEKFYNIPELYGIPLEEFSTDAKRNAALAEWYDPAELARPEFQQFLKYHCDIVLPNKWIPFRTELVIFDTELQMAGTIDMVYRDGLNKKCLHFIDWKRSKEIKREGFRRERGKGPCAHLQDCNYIHYSLQVNIYAGIFLKMYQDSFNVSCMFLVVCHPNYCVEFVDKAEYEYYNATEVKRRKPFNRDAMPIGYQIIPCLVLVSEVYEIFRKRAEEVEEEDAESPLSQSE